jgi:hypothetical protein
MTIYKTTGAFPTFRKITKQIKDFVSSPMISKMTMKIKLTPHAKVNKAR